MDQENDEKKVEQRDQVYALDSLTKVGPFLNLMIRSLRWVVAGWWKRMVWAGVRVGEVLGEASGRQAAAASTNSSQQQQHQQPADPSSNSSVLDRSVSFCLFDFRLHLRVQDLPASGIWFRTSSPSKKKGSFQVRNHFARKDSMLPLGGSTSKRNSSRGSIEGGTGWQPPPSTTLKKWWPWWLLLPGCFASWTKYVDEYDAIRVARCDARCGSDHPDECMENCLASNYTKPGYCPERGFMTPFEAVCLIACDVDSNCPELAKCCSHDCGVTCMHPVGLENITDLPPIPQNLQIRQQKSNLIHLTWRNIGQPYQNGSKNNYVRYLVEERHLLGPRYLETRLSSWAIRHVSTKPHATLRGRLKTGHWYQFRVAAINENGSRGYSQPSRPFKTKEPRNPKEPQNLTLSGARMVAGKLRINLRWVKPASDVPITFYKVFWSRRIHSPTNDSVLVYHRTVRKDKTCYELKNLEPKCQYFLQVQAVALYGGRRLASRKASKVFNATDYMAFADVGRRSRRCERFHGGLHVRRMICHCGDVKVRLVWSIDQNAKMYNVSWKQESCSSSYDENPELRKKILWKVVQTPHYDLRHLQQDCTYSVNVQNLYNNERRDEHGSSIEFFATGCQLDHEEKRWKYSSKKGAQCKMKNGRSRKYSENTD